MIKPKRIYIRRTALNKYLAEKISERANCYYELSKWHLFIYISKDIFMTVSHLAEIASLLQVTRFQLEGRVIIFHFRNRVYEYSQALNKFLDKCITKINAKSKVTH